MDEDVIKAMARWPDVPAAYGWLSLDARGRWRLHPAGDAAAGGPGEAIDHPGVLAFMNRNYTCEGRDWYVQNGPQRAYVRLDAAPYLLCRADAGPGLQTHTGLAVGKVVHWWLDEEGRLYAATDRGPGMVQDRELPLLLERLRTAKGEPALQAQDTWLAGLAASDERIDLAVTANGSDEYLGEIVLDSIDLRLGSANLRLTMRPAYRGRGYGTEAILLVLGMVFDGLGLHRVGAAVPAINARAHSLYENLGFRVEGRLRDAFRDGDGWTDGIVMGLLEDEYRAAQHA